ncbi:7000_t:CDS:2, partial [Paraglomus occultum]
MSNNFVFITKEKFNELLTNYLSDKQYNKSIISREVASKLLDFFTNTGNNEVDAQFKFWAKRRFKTMTIGDTVKVIHKKRKTPICAEHELYDVIGNYHLELQHAGYRKTYAAISQHYSYVPRELVRLFIEVQAEERNDENNQVDIPDSVDIENYDEEVQAEERNDENNQVESDNSIQLYDEDGESPPPLPPPISFSSRPSPQLNIDDEPQPEFNIDDESQPGLSNNEPYYSSDDNEIYISQCETGYYIKDNMMYKPFKILPPSPNRHSYVFPLNAWLMHKIATMSFTLNDKEFILKCLDDLRNWNNHTSEDDHIIEEDQLSEIFEEWPDRIKRWEELNQGDDNSRVDESGSVEELSNVDNSRVDESGSVEELSNVDATSETEFFMRGSTSRQDVIRRIAREQIDRN